jgi:deoxyribodipyrimidine photo-lyase
MNLLAKREYAAYTIRPKIKKLLPNTWKPCPEPLPAVKWTAPAPAFHTEVAEADIPSLVASCEINHAIKPSLSYTGGRLPPKPRCATSWTTTSAAMRASATNRAPTPPLT